MKKEVAYLLGLICARGHIYSANKRIVIEFAHKNKEAEGIAYCPKCGWLATKKGNNQDHTLVCKNPNCQSKVPNTVKKIYEQVESTKNSIKNIIIPFLCNEFQCSCGVSGNDTMTFLFLDFANSENDFRQICSYFPNQFAFDSFVIPKELEQSNREAKIEFINGIMDTAGFFNAGGWLPRPGGNGYGRMRAYFQIVRNWKMPVLLCNFLKKEFNLPIHTIDWGHPNIRDSGLADYLNSTTTSWSREHQIKFFPEFYTMFTPRILHKREMLHDLIEHNKKVIFTSKDDCSAPNKITKTDIKANHPEENSSRIPMQTRKHCDTFWQVCMNMGCTQCHCVLQEAKNKDSIKLLGCDLSEKEQKEQISLYQKILGERNFSVEQKIKKSDTNKTCKTKTSGERNNPEQKLYAPIVEWYSHYLTASKEECFVADTSARNLDKFIAENSLHNYFEEWEELKIKPDIIGIVKNTGKIGIIEVKATSLSLQNVGQLLGYCLVANPDEAILISSKPISLNLSQAIYANPSILEYLDGKRIKVAYWDGKQAIFEDNKNDKNKK